jgi:hypothetical protein
MISKVKGLKNLLWEYYKMYALLILYELIVQVELNWQ